MVLKKSRAQGVVNYVNPDQGFSSLYGYIIYYMIIIVIIIIFLDIFIIIFYCYCYYCYCNDITMTINSM